jgi:rare lipoprotein A (peptidoglycan hydrolase)
MTAMTALVIAGCGSHVASHATASPQSASVTVAQATRTIPARAHPQVVEPTAGVGGAVRTATRPDPPAAPPGQAPRAPSPDQPASVSQAPAKGAPTDAEVRAAVARFKAAVAQYHLDRLNLAGALINPSLLPPGVYDTSIASVFTDYGRPIACGGVLHVPQLGVANKTLPCGTQVIFVYNGRAVKVPVIDRGPYIPGREWDLTGATAEALRFPGLGPIQWRLAG